MSRLLKKTHMLRCAQSSRYNVLAKYASARRFSRALPLNLFEQPAIRVFQHPASPRSCCPEYSLAASRTVARGADSAGFTLIEVVLALAIFALLGTILYGAFALSHSAVDKSQASAARNQKQRSVADLLGSYIRSAYPYRNSPQEQEVFFEGASDSLAFVSAYSHGMGGRGMAKIFIGFDGNGSAEAALLLEEVTPVRLNTDEGPIGESHRVILEDRVEGMRIAYLDPDAEAETWEERWDGKERRMLPRAVRLSYRDPDGKEVRWIFPIMMHVLRP